MEDVIKAFESAIKWFEIYCKLQFIKLTDTYFRTRY